MVLGEAICVRCCKRSMKLDTGFQLPTIRKPIWAEPGLVFFVLTSIEQGTSCIICMIQTLYMILVFMSLML